MLGGYNFDLGLTDEDLAFLDSLNRSGPSQPAHIDLEKPLPREVLFDEHSGNQHGPNAYHDSPLSNWTPSAEDNAFMDQHYLSVPKHLDTPPSRAHAMPRVFPGYLSMESRDSAFGVCVRISQNKGLDRIMRCFPSAELLDRLINDFFIQQRLEIDTWIHESTMQLDQETPEMILTLAAAGAVLSKLEAIRRLGHAMLEVARLQVNDKVLF